MKELKEISKIFKKNVTYIHIDGTIFSNAIVSMGITSEIFVKGIQTNILYFGGTKNGLIFGEAILIFNKDLLNDILSLRKQNLQLMSKMRFLSVQFIIYLQKNL